MIDAIINELSFLTTEDFWSKIPYILVYFIPTIIGDARDHNNSTAIFVTNFLLGWTGIGWVVALIWSFTNNTEG